ncbi:MAG: twin-arginine translocation signal domain-containing protein, partial [Actinomycetota bacterium]
MEGTERPALSRRGFLKGAGAGTALVVAGSQGWLNSGFVSSLVEENGVLIARLIRPADQLRLQLEFENLRYEASSGQLVADGIGTPLMRMVLPRQHIVEEPIAAGTTPPGAGSAPINHRAARNSRLVFEVTPPIDYDVPTLLDLAAYTLRTTVAAGDPADDQTVIEVPADLRWSPGASTSLRADVDPISAPGSVPSVTVSQVHRIFMERTGGDVEFTPVFNALGTEGFTRIPNAGDRDQIVTLATTEGPATATRAWLTPYGAWADLEAEWSSLDWIQQVQGGRDQFAQVVVRGVLMPFGHEAVWTETATRLWLADSDGELVSTLVRETHFAVAGSDATQFPSPASPAGGRNMPFSEVLIEQQDNETVKKLAIDWDDGAESLSINDAWVVAYDAPGAIFDGAQVRVAYTATDKAGNPPATFTLPAVFVRTTSLADPAVADGLRDFYASDTPSAVVKSASLGGSSRVAWAEPISPGSDITTFLTSKMEFGLDPDASVAAGELPIAPIVTFGVVSKPELLGERPTPEQLAIEVEFSPNFIVGGLSGPFNPSSAFLDLINPTTFALGNEARAVMTPDLVATEFNQGLGIGADLPPINGGADFEWRPADAFGDKAQILRGINLADLVLPILFDIALPGIDIPEFDFETFNDRIEQRYVWCPETIESKPNLGFEANVPGRPDTTLCVELTTVIALDDTVEAGVTVEFSVKDFTLLIPPANLDVIQLDVNELRAIQTTSGSTDFALDIAEWRLGGLLAFLEPLITLLTPTGSAFDLDIASTEIVADLDISLPDIDLGVLAITNFAIGLTGTFPFVGDDEPRLGIAVGSRRDPVSLQIMQFRGGFSLELEFSANGLELVHVTALVAARLFEIDIKIATAYCEVGILAEFILSGGRVTFAGELSLTAHFSVAGIVNATLTISGRVEYKEQQQNVTISGTIYWEVSVVLKASGRVPIGSITFSVGDGAANGVAATRRGCLGRAG